MEQLPRTQNNLMKVHPLCALCALCASVMWNLGLSIALPQGCTVVTDNLAYCCDEMDEQG